MSKKTEAELWWEVVIKAVALYCAFRDMAHTAQQQEEAWHEIAEEWHEQTAHKPKPD